MGQDRQYFWRYFGIVIKVFQKIIFAIAVSTVPGHQQLRCCTLRLSENRLHLSWSSAPVPRRDEGFFESDDAESTSGTTGLRDESVPLRGVAERETGTGNRDDDIKIVNDHVFKTSMSNNNATKSAMSSNVNNTGKNRVLTRFSAPDE